MKLKNKILITVATVALAVSAVAKLPTFKTFSTGAPGGAGPAPAVINIPEDPNLQIRVVDVGYTSDTNIGSITFTTGSTAFVVLATNIYSAPYTSSSVTNVVNTTNGLSPSAALILTHAGACYTNTISLWSSLGTGTNFIVLPSGGWGVAPVAGDSIYIMGQASVTRYVGMGTNGIDGEAIYVGNYGRPVTVTMSPALVTNRLAVTVHYDSQSQ